MDNEDLYWDDINDYEQIPCWDENGELSDDDECKEHRFVMIVKNQTC